jgi:hypothetical protein
MTLQLTRQYQGQYAQAASFNNMSTGAKGGYAAGYNPNTGNAGGVIGGYNPATGNGFIAAGTTNGTQAAGMVAVGNSNTGQWAYLMGEVDKATQSGSIKGATSNGASLDAAKTPDNSHCKIESEKLKVDMENGTGTIQTQNKSIIIAEPFVMYA